MRTWLEAGEEAKVRRQPCIECGPVVGDQMDPQTWLECSRYAVLQARDPESLARILLQSRPGAPSQDPHRLIGATHEVVMQVREHDPAFSRWWTEFTTASDHQRR